MTVHQVSASNNSDMCVLNIAEFNQVKKKNSGTEKCLTIYDGAADSAFISSHLASKLGDQFKKKVILHLQTIPDEKDFETYQHEVLIRVGNNYRQIYCYECPALGVLHKAPGVEAAVTEALQTDIKIPHGQVDLLLGLKQFSLHPTADVPFTLMLPSQFSEVKLLHSATTGQCLVGGALCRAFIRELQGEGEQESFEGEVFY